MSRHPLFLVDVFAERRYAGNQLAVVTRAADLDASTMQAIAREMNFSETAFVLHDEARGGAFDVRIFTPREEVPFAGHPTIGTAWVIRNELLQAAPAGVTNVVRLMKRSNPKVEKVKPEQLIDDRILKKLDQSGFIDEVLDKYGVK